MKAIFTLLAVPLLTIVLAPFQASLLISSQGENAMGFAISSSNFANGGDIPKRFTCDGGDVSPQLSWTQPPSGTQSLALVVDDPDAPAGDWTHWLAFNLPPDSNGLGEDVPKIDQLAHGGYQGRNDFHRIGYGGPCPPAGKPHRYFFKLYALDQKLNLNPGASKRELEQAMRARHILGEAQWMGKYGR